MSGKLRLGPLPKNEVVRLTIALPATVKADLDNYAALYGRTYGEAVDAAALVPHMLATFMERDRAFKRHAQAASSEGRDGSASLATSPAISSTNDTAAESSSSR